MVIIITGPTASGKTALAERLVPLVDGAVINADMGQCYTKLSVGTAKPDWRSLPYETHLFDVINEPRDITVVAFKQLLDRAVSSVAAKGKTSLIVGGSSFYIKSLFYQPHETPLVKSVDIEALERLSTAELWQELQLVDPERAALLYPTDRYRLLRALTLWHGTGQKPSSLKPAFVMPFDKALLVIVLPPRPTMVDRIARRTAQMVQYDGWVEEARQLLGTAWEQFATKLIGYEELFAWLRAGAEQSSLAGVIEAITIKTRQYAKRQEIFLKKMARDVQADALASGAQLSVIFVEDDSLQSANKIAQLAGVDPED